MRTLGLRLLVVAALLCLGLLVAPLLGIVVRQPWVQWTYTGVMLGCYAVGTFLLVKAYGENGGNKKT